MNRNEKNVEKIIYNFAGVNIIFGLLLGLDMLIISGIICGILLNQIFLTYPLLFVLFFSGLITCYYYLLGKEYAKTLDKLFKDNKNEF